VVFTFKLSERQKDTACAPHLFHWIYKLEHARGDFVNGGKVTLTCTD
jgi:hypothetical protein